MVSVNIKTFGGDYITFDRVTGVNDLLVKLREYNDQYDIVCLYDIGTEEMIEIDDELKDGQDLFMVVSMVDVEMNILNSLEKYDPKFYVNVEFKFTSKDLKNNQNEDIFYYPSTGVVIESFLCCDQCEYRDEYRDLESYLEKKLNYPEYQKKLAIRDASVLWNKWLSKGFIP